MQDEEGLSPPEGGRGPLGPIRFSQRLSLWRAIARGLGVIVAASVFLVLGDVADLGPLVPAVFLLAALLIIINGLGYAELAISSLFPGGAYTLVYRGMGNEGLAFLTGWALILANIALCGLLAQGAGRYIAALVAQASGLEIPSQALATALVVFMVVPNALQRHRRGRLDFALPLLIMLLVLAVASIPHLQGGHSVSLRPRLGPMIPAVFVAFIGLEVIPSYQREVRQRATNLPRALLLAPAVSAVVAAVIGALAVSVAGPGIVAGAQAPLAPVGEVIAGAWGQLIVLVAGAGFLLFSLNRVLSMSVRKAYVMSRDGFWPQWLRQLHPRWGTPLRLVVLTGLMILPIVWVPEELLSRTGGLLYLFTLMAVNLALAVRPRPAVSPEKSEEGHRRSFSLPFHPWVPALILAIDVLVIPLWGMVPVAATAACLAIGALVYAIYGRGRYEEAQEGVTVFRSPEERVHQGYRVLVPVANPATARALLRLAGRLAQVQGGEVLALQVIVVPEPMPLEVGRRRARLGQELLEQVLVLANEEDLPIHTMTRVARGIPNGILDTAVEEDVDLILVGRRVPARTRDVSLGATVEGVLRDALCDVLVVGGQGIELPERILVPTSGGPHAKAATRLALSLAKAFQAEVTLLCVQAGPDTAQEREACQSRIADTLDGLSGDLTPEHKIVRAPSIVDGIVQEAENYALVLLGVSEESLLDRLVFGSVPLQVAARVPTTALVQAARGISVRWTRRMLRILRENLPALDTEQQEAVRRELSRGARPGINFFVLIVLSSIIAALGLLLSSPAVVIGAMLVAPLMSPIMAISLGMVLGDVRLIRIALETTAKGVALAVIIGAFTGLLSPLRTITPEMFARGQPNLLDLAVALASGMAGAYALARKDVSAALPGVAIAAALVPPLATVGLGLALGNPRVAGGALLLFLANIAAISLAGGIVFLGLGIRPHTWGAKSRQQLRWRLTISLLLVLVVAIPLGIILLSTVSTASQQRVVETALVEYLAAHDAELVEFDIEQGSDEPVVVAVVRSTDTLDQHVVDELAQTLRAALRRRVGLEVVVLPTIRAQN